MNLRTRPRPRRGTIYLVVLGVSLIVAALAYGGIVVTRAKQRETSAATDAADARQNAESGVALARLWIRQDSTWRTSRAQGTWATNVATPTGSFTVAVTDPTDANFANRPHDSAVMKVTGKKGNAQHTVEVTLSAVPDPLPALAYALHTGGELYIATGKTATMSSATASANGNFRNDGTLIGNIQSQGVSQAGTVTGTSNFSAGTKALPAMTVVDNYVAIGTAVTLPVVSTVNMIDKKILAAGKNPFGATLNADGVYVVAPASGDVTIRNSRINGTLVVICPSGGKVKIDNKVFIHPFRSDYPALIIKGDADFSFTGGDGLFSEAAIVTNLNPVGAPYNGVTDSGFTTLYDSEIQGLVHVTGKARFHTNSTRFEGVVLVGSTDVQSASIEQSLTIVYTPSLLTSPPQWYTVDVKMIPQLGTWKQLAN